MPSNQLPTVWFFDKRLHEDVRLISKIQMVDVFEMYKEEMGCQLVVGLFDNDAEFDDLHPLCTISPEVRFEIPTMIFPLPMNQIVLLLTIQRLLNLVLLLLTIYKQILI